MSKLIVSLLIVFATFSFGCDKSKLAQLPGVTSALISVLETSPLPDKVKEDVKPYTTIIQKQMERIKTLSEPDADTVVVLVESIQDVITTTDVPSVDLNTKTQIKNYGLWAITILKLVPLFF